MKQKTYRDQQTFLEEFKDYLIGEFKALGQMFGLILLAVYVFVSLVVGLWQVGSFVVARLLDVMLGRV